MALSRTPKQVRIAEAHKIFYEVEALMDYLTPKDQFCSGCVGVPTDETFAQKRHEDNCLRTKISNWRRGEFEEV